jgi:hypothetical protein
MNCAVCGSPLPLSRAIFHCSCGVFVHAYCWEQHVSQAHQPAFETGTVDLNGEFRVSGGEVEQAAKVEQASEIEQVSEAEQVSEMEPVSGEQITSPDE